MRTVVMMFDRFESGTFGEKWLEDCEQFPIELMAGNEHTLKQSEHIRVLILNANENKSQMSLFIEILCIKH